ncbi:phytanoyl-CoA dioxygenase [Virgisporangium aliadipatigenens]|uniref:Phytanoyl-CoA dioxygenase n=1 Tax=Virgisporangium aliadipatigenens TaxID=741659 RepID=A0A8J3YM06_9ACTN|nr:phytanoyl-CoA dioxygenase family protein [Virgisporangium aliadipatigenens]GIJ46326.1 phytanoyl-CoA dioxygenase [Virgisporangium aliadipatigenens]
MTLSDTAPPVLDDEQVARFEEDGFVKVAGAIPRELADECRALAWRHINADPDDRSTWTEAVEFIFDAPDPLFVRAGNTPTLHAAYDRLAGRGRWHPLRNLGWFVVRLPGLPEPSDTGWHVDGSYPLGEGRYGLNLWSRNRSLLVLMLFSDVGSADAPTRIRVGSHLDVPRLLAPAGRAGTSDAELFRLLGPTESRPVALATGNAGDVYLCHPFLVHAGQAHRGSVPRFLAQPPLTSVGELNLDPANPAPTPVERAVLRGLAA